jgi:hypothetical protein
MTAQLTSAQTLRSFMARQAWLVLMCGAPGMHNRARQFCRRVLVAQCCRILLSSKDYGNESPPLTGTQLPHDLHLIDDGTVAVVDEGTLVVPPHPGFPLPKVCMGA